LYYIIAVRGEKTMKLLKKPLIKIGVERAIRNFRKSCTRDFPKATSENSISVEELRTLFCGNISQD